MSSPKIEELPSSDEEDNTQQKQEQQQEEEQQNPTTTTTDNAQDQERQTTNATTNTTTDADDENDESPSTTSEQEDRTPEETIDATVDLTEYLSYEPSLPYSPTALQGCFTEAEKYKAEGNQFFGRQEFNKAIALYTKAICLCPRNRRELAAYYANRGACHMKQENYEGCVDDCSRALHIQPVYPKVSMRRAVAHEQLDELDEALTDYKEVLIHDPGNREAQKATKRLPQQIEEKTERLKQEMFGNLRKLGNMCLKPFGLSTDNFQMVQDPNTGGYSINFSQNK